MRISDWSSDVCSSDLLRQAVERRRLLDLGHDGGAVADQAARLGQVLRPLDEGEGDPVDTEVERELQVDAVLLGDRRDRQDDARQVDALVVAQGAAGDHTGLRMAGGARSEEHTSALQSLMRISYAVFCLK